MPSVLWRCWLGGRKGIRPVKNWVVGCWRGYVAGARCILTCIWPSWCHCHSVTWLSLASVKSRLVLPFWCRLTRVVPEKGLLNGRVCVLLYDDVSGDYPPQPELLPPRTAGRAMAAASDRDRRKTIPSLFDLRFPTTTTTPTTLSTSSAMSSATGPMSHASTRLPLPPPLSVSHCLVSLIRFDLPRHTCSLMNRFQTGHGPCCVTCTNQVSSNHLPVIVASDRPWTTLSTRAH